MHEERKKITVRIGQADFETLAARAAAAGMSITALVDQFWRVGAGMLAHAGTDKQAASTCQHGECRQLLAELETRLNERLEALPTRTTQAFWATKVKKQSTEGGNQ